MPVSPSNDARDLSTTSLPEGVAFVSAWIPWLSQHHRMLFHHFTGTTIQIFDDSQAVQQEIRSTIVPMAVDTNHGFSLLAAILSLASTHRRNLGLHQDSAEIEYWRDMSVGHLRRPGIQEDGSTENVFAATALMLCIRDTISDVERPFSWKLHLQGALTVLKKNGDHLSPAAHSVRVVLTKLARSLQLRSLLPAPLSIPGPSSLDSGLEDTDKEVYGLPAALTVILQDIRDLRLERFALQNIEKNSNSSNMAPLWAALRGRCLEVIVAVRTFTDETSARDDEFATLHRLYAYVALLQIYSGILELPMSDSGLKSTLDVAMSLLRNLRTERSTEISVVLVFPLFTIGCLVRSPEDRRLINASLIRVAREHGKANATLAKSLLGELWNKADAKEKPVEQADVDQLTSKS